MNSAGSSVTKFAMIRSFAGKLSRDADIAVQRAVPLCGLLSLADCISVTFKFTQRLSLLL